MVHTMDPKPSHTQRLVASGEEVRLLAVATVLYNPYSSLVACTRQVAPPAISPYPSVVVGSRGAPVHLHHPRPIAIGGRSFVSSSVHSCARNRRPSSQPHDSSASAVILATGSALIYPPSSVCSLLIDVPSIRRRSYLFLSYALPRCLQNFNSLACVLT